MPNTQFFQQPFRYINGLQVSNNATTPNTKLDIALGQARDSTNVADIALTAGVTLNAAVVGANGIDTGALAASTKYAVYLIGSTKNLAQPATILSTSFTAPTYPTGYDVYVRIGMAKTDGSSHFLLFTRSGEGLVRYHEWLTPVSLFTAQTQTSFTAQSLAAGRTLQATRTWLNASYVPNNAANTAQIRATGSAVAEDSVPVILTGAVGSVAMKGAPFMVQPLLATGNPSIDWLVQASDTLTLNLVGFEDVL
jgi:hypothetical protein